MVMNTGTAATAASPPTQTMVEQAKKLWPVEKYAYNRIVQLILAPEEKMAATPKTHPLIDSAFTTAAAGTATEVAADVKTAATAIAVDVKSAATNTATMTATNVDTKIDVKHATVAQRTFKDHPPKQHTKILRERLYRLRQLSPNEWWPSKKAQMIAHSDNDTVVNLFVTPNNTLLLTAVIYGALPYVREVIQHGILHNKSLSYLALWKFKGNSVLHVAAQNGELEIFIYLYEALSSHEVSSRANLLLKTNEQNETPLFCALRNGHLPLARHILHLMQNNEDAKAASANPASPSFALGPIVHRAIEQVRDTNGQTALDWAVTRGLLDVVRYLIEECGMTQTSLNANTLEEGIDRDLKDDFSTDNVVNYLLGYGITEEKLQEVFLHSATGAHLFGKRDILPIIISYAPPRPFFIITTAIIMKVIEGGYNNVLKYLCRFTSPAVLNAEVHVLPSPLDDSLWGIPTDSHLLTTATGHVTITPLIKATQKNNVKAVEILIAARTDIDKSVIRIIVSNNYRRDYEPTAVTIANMIFNDAVADSATRMNAEKIMIHLWFAGARLPGLTSRPFTWLKRHWLFEMMALENPVHNFNDDYFPNYRYSVISVANSDIFSSIYFQSFTLNNPFALPYPTEGNFYQIYRRREKDNHFLIFYEVIGVPVTAFDPNCKSWDALFNDLIDTHQISCPVQLYRAHLTLSYAGFGLPVVRSRGRGHGKSFPNKELLDSPINEASLARAMGLAANLSQEEQLIFHTRLIVELQTRLLNIIPLSTKQEPQLRQIPTEQATRLRQNFLQPTVKKAQLTASQYLALAKFTKQMECKAEPIACHTKALDILVYVDEAYCRATPKDKNRENSASILFQIVRYYEELKPQLLKLTAREAKLATHPLVYLEVNLYVDALELLDNLMVNSRVIANDELIHAALCIVVSQPHFDLRKCAVLLAETDTNDAEVITMLAGNDNYRRGLFAEFQKFPPKKQEQVFRKIEKTGTNLHQLFNQPVKQPVQRPLWNFWKRDAPPFDHIATMTAARKKLQEQSKETELKAIPGIRAPMLRGHR